ncbi:DUF4350 domain-containing protein [Brachybacterium sp. AOP43-C2-M15]|uniref:DUF4350 domain-containing protein n=1 Tax=Brachybacterium sp. AOP43-C2-M15 TaxID=3457661 RepID=UPI00403346E2
MSFEAAPAPTVPVGGTAADPAPGPAAPRRRRPLLIVLIALAMIAAVLASVARGLYRDGELEPDAPTDQGSKAVVQVLEDLGVAVDVDRHTADAAEALRSGRTVLVTDPGRLAPQQVSALADAREAGDGRLVLVRPDALVLASLSDEITPSSALRDSARLEAGPDCGDLAHRARVLEVPHPDDGLRGAAALYRTDDRAEACFGDDSGALVAEHDGLIVLGSADLLTNAGVGRADNSALVLNVLAADGELSWYVPSTTDPMGTSSQSLLGYLPGWTGPVVLWLLLTAVLALVAAGRRFGPVVVEPLPVTVRPQELVLGSARLLQRADARDGAAASLRAATAVRLADRLGLRHESSLDGLVATLAPQTERSAEELRALLGPTPVTTDQDLVRLAHDLDRLEKEIDR